ncbi:MAG: ribosome recycling factor [bacterium]
MEPLALAEGDTKSFETRVEMDMENPIIHYEKELATIRTGRASTKLVEDIKIEAYGQQMRLKELATLTAPEASLITIQPWDKTIIMEIEKGITASDLGVTPINDGAIIRIQLPKMSSERREELNKILSKKTEECKIGVRNVRKDYHNLIRETEKKHDISEDFAKRLTDVLQKITDKFIKKADELNDRKANEIKF